MSDAVLALTNLTIDKYEKRVDDSISLKIPEWWWWRNHKGAMQMNMHGPGRRWQSRVLRGVVKGFTRDTRLAPVRKNRVIQPRLTNRGYGIGEMIHQTDIWENGKPEQLFPLLEDMLDGINGDIIDAAGTGVYDDGTDATYGGFGFEGLNAALTASGGTYAGISQATYPRFYSSPGCTNVVTTATGVYAQFGTNPLVALDSAITNCRAGDNMGKTRQGPDVGFMDHDLFNICHHTFIGFGHMPLNQTAVKAGFNDHFVYRGVTFFPSDYVPANYVYVLNSKYIDFAFPSPKVINEYREQSGIPWAIYVLLVIYGHMRVRLPRTCGRFAVST